ncbi:MAG: MarR family transcriptional regulator [Deltaproteobacteria bacterium]|nr:MarR family transcriptional regulator [Deltaproteobacteria bacterium]
MNNNNYKIDNCARKTPVAPENKTQIVQLLLKNGLFLQREVNQVFRRFGLKQQQFSVLDGIVWHGPINQKELGETLLFEKSNISKIVRILTEKKMINVVTNPIDRRLTLLSETPSGFSVWKGCMQALNESSEIFFSQLSENEISQAIKLLKKIQKSFKTK